MRTNKILSLLALVVFSVMLVFSACKKDDDDKPSENLLENSYFTVENGVYKNGDFPAQSDYTYDNAQIITLFQSFYPPIFSLGIESSSWVKPFPILLSSILFFISE